MAILPTDVNPRFGPTANFNAAPYIVQYADDDKLSPLSDVMFEVDGIMYCSPQNYYEIKRAQFYGDVKASDGMDYDGGEGCIVRGKDIVIPARFMDSGGFPDRAIVVMYEALSAHFRENEEPKQQLLQTLHRPLFYACPDHIWGVGMVKVNADATKISVAYLHGMNIIGKLLQIVRTELQTGIPRRDEVEQHFPSLNERMLVHTYYAADEHANSPVNFLD